MTEEIFTKSVMFLFRRPDEKRGFSIGLPMDFGDSQVIPQRGIFDGINEDMSQGYDR